MASRDQFMLVQVVFSIDRLFTATDLPLCLAYLRHPHRPALGVAAARAAVLPRRSQKIRPSFREMQKEKSLMLQSLTSGKLIVSLILVELGFRN